MSATEKLNPALTAAVIILLAVPALFCTDAVLSATAFLLSAAWWFILSGRKGAKLFFGAVGIFLIFTAANVLFNHRGVTVLFFLNSSPVTLESAIYGAVSAASLSSAFLIFASFSRIMTSEKLTYIFGSVSSRFGLVFSMSLRAVPLFSRRFSEVKAARKGLGLYKKDNIIDSIREGMTIFSTVAGWALENGVITADSMDARGYGLGKRTFFARYRFSRRDAVFSAVFGAVSVIFFVALIKSDGTVFYPSYSPPPENFARTAAYAAYAVMFLIVTVSEITQKSREEVFFRERDRSK